LKQLPRDFRYAVELRNPELLTDVHGACSHATAWPTCSILERDAGDSASSSSCRDIPAGFTVARGCSAPGGVCDAVKLFEPYDRIRDRNRRCGWISCASSPK